MSSTLTLLEKYSKRSLLFNSDLLNAVRSVLTVFLSRLSQSVFCIPISYTDLALLSSPDQPHACIAPIGTDRNVFPTWF